MRISHRLHKAALIILCSLVVMVSASPALASGQSLELLPDLTELIALVLAFGVLLVPLDRLLFRPLLEVFDAREAKIAGAQQKAESLREHGDELLASYERSIRDSRDTITAERKQLIREARAQEEAITQAERRESEQSLAAARAELEASLSQVRTELRQNVRALGREAAERVLGRALS